MPTRSDEVALDRAWSDVFAHYPATFAVTVTYNPVMCGTIFTPFRITDVGECIELPMPALRARPDVRRLATPRRIVCEKIHRDLDRLHRDADRQLFGPRFHKRGPDRRTGFIGMIEGAEHSPHAHLAWRVPEGSTEQFAELIGPLWLKMSPYGTTDIKRIFDAAGWASYCTKLRPAQQPPELFVASRRP